MFAYITNIRVYSYHVVLSKIKKRPGPDVVKLFTTVIDECWYQARMIVPGRPFKPGLCGEGQEPTLEWIT
jgi:hypothetical protein